jgi:hypothetical protein
VHGETKRGTSASGDPLGTAVRAGELPEAVEELVKRRLPRRAAALIRLARPISPFALQLLTDAGRKITNAGEIVPLDDVESHLVAIAHQRLAPHDLLLQTESFHLMMRTILDAWRRSKDEDRVIESSWWFDSPSLFDVIATVDYRDKLITKSSMPSGSRPPLPEQFNSDAIAQLSLNLRLGVKSPISEVRESCADETDETRRFVLQYSESSHDQAEAVARIALRTAQIDYLKQDLAEGVRRAREVGVSWSDVGRAAGLSPQAALRRWDQEARRKHSEYQRNRQQQLRGEDAE